jgi:hypothetical protein
MSALDIESVDAQTRRAVERSEGGGLGARFPDLKRAETAENTEEDSGKAQ